MAYTQDQFDWQSYINSGAASAGVSQGGNSDAEHEGARAYQDYLAKGGTWKNPADAAAAAAQSSQSAATTTSVVPGTAAGPGQQNVADYAAQVAANPNLVVNAQNGTSVAAGTAGQVGQAASINPNDPNFQLGQTPNTQAHTVDQVAPTQANTYDVKNTQQDVANNQMTGAQGQIKDQDLVTAQQEDMQGLATGKNADGSVNYTGQALQQYASQNMSNVIDTSTSAGKLLAQQLGDGNYLDSKATLQGQLALLQQQFVDPTTGEPKIPSWAASTARNVSKIMAFSGMTGTAATAAMSQALLEASLPIAQADSQFFQTLTVTNLNNKQQSTINAANVLAKFEETNLDNRQQAAVTNAQSFLAMDLKNLDNDQQAAVVNNQARIQSILTDAGAENAKRQFTASSQNDLDKFYAQLNSQIGQFNATQLTNTDQFNATMEDSRQKYEAEMQYNIAVSNANWRQQVQMQDDQQAYEAVTTDVKNKLDISTQQLNQIWDRSDALLDYSFKASESAKDRQSTLAIAQMQASSKSKDANMTAIGQLAGTFVGSSTFSTMMNKAFGI